MTVTHELGRFTLACPGGPAELTYVLTELGVAMTHTLVPRKAEGTGVGSALTRAALDWARDADLEVDPQCWFVAGWLDRHPDHGVRRRS